MRSGLWRYSRHPNYFFQWLTWVAYALDRGRRRRGAGSRFFAPALILYLILFVTGVPPSEESALRSRGDDYRRYQRETSVFVPWFPKRRRPADRVGPRARPGPARSASAPTCALRLRARARGAAATRARSSSALRGAPIAEQVEKANEQHYEVPAEFFRARARPAAEVQLVPLAAPASTRSPQAEEAMLALTCERARGRGRHDAARPRLRLGLAHALARRALPAPRRSSPSRTRGVQREFIERAAPPNVEVVTADVNVFEPGAALRPDPLGRDARAHAQLRGAARADRVAGSSRAGASSCHVFTPPPLRVPVRRAAGWRARSSRPGTMPSDDLLPRFQRDLAARGALARSAARTTRARPRPGSSGWTRTRERRARPRRRVRRRAGARWPANWRVFFLACAELWGFRGGARVARLALPVRTGRRQGSRQNGPVRPTASRIAWFCSRVCGRQSGSSRSAHHATASSPSCRSGSVAPARSRSPRASAPCALPTGRGSSCFR